jgi:peroxiredoxin
LSSQEAELDVSGLGRIHLQRSVLRRMLRWHHGADLVYVGPNGLSEWAASWPEGAWRQEGGHLLTVHDGAWLAGDFNVPEQATIEFELAWTSGPDFTFAIGSSAQDSLGAFRLEVLERELVLIRETQEEADLAPLQHVRSGAGSCHFVLYLDLPHNRAVVFSDEGKLLAELDVSDAAPRPKFGLRLVNHHGTVRLKQLRIMRWNGDPPHEVEAGKTRLHREGGSVAYGEIEGFDAATKEFLTTHDGQPLRIPAGDVESVVWSGPADVPARQIRVLLHDGTRLSGSLGKVEAGRLWLTCPGITEPLGAPLPDLQSLVVLDERKPSWEPTSRGGRLEADGFVLHGCLLDGSQQPDASCLVWQPRGSATASPLKHGVAGRIVYRDASAPSSSQPAQSSSNRQQPPAQVLQGQGGAQGGFLAGVVRVLAGEPAPVTSKPATPSSQRFGPTLYLRTGDTIPCTVERIDERGVTFRSPMFDVTSVAHDKIKAVELENWSRTTKIDPSKRDRLLTLPRMQKDDPPTHLIRSTDGDYLRARLVSLDDTTATVEVRLETRRLPRKQITRIIWLDAGKPDSPGKVAPSPDPSNATRVQAIRDDGIRLTFLAEKLTDKQLEGTSDVLGACRVEVSEVDQLLIGNAIEQAMPALPYQRWKLQPAVEPKFASKSAEEGTDAGTESALVGKPAPEFELDTLDGKRFRLADHKGKVVVLDFWATWCGACIQTMPEVVRTVKECGDPKVMLVAVNLQETPEAITATLDRLELVTTVALDREGAVARQYAAAAIPQTVIIDPDGKVARLFVGGDPQFADQLREALQSLLKPAGGQDKPPTSTDPTEPGK